MSKKKETPSCPHNAAVECSTHNCDRCGWNPRKKATKRITPLLPGPMARELRKLKIAPSYCRSCEYECSGKDGCAIAREAAAQLATLYRIVATQRDCGNCAHEHIEDDACCKSADCNCLICKQDCACRLCDDGNNRWKWEGAKEVDRK